jgi:hypothetical protein
MTAIYAFSVPLMNSNTNSTNYFAIAKKTSTPKQLTSEATDFTNNDASVSLINHDKMKDDAIAHLSDQLVVLTARLQEVERKQQL